MNPSDHNHTARDPMDQDPAEYSEEWLSAYIDDELTAAQRAIVEQRIASDSHAQRLLNELQHMRSLIGQIPSWSGALIDHAYVTQRKPLADDSADVVADEVADGPNDRWTATESSLHSESFPETLEQARLSHDEAAPPNPELVHTTGDMPRRDVSWWRPLALAACLALLTGGGIWWWQSKSPTTLATSARITEPADELARDDAPPAIQFKAAPEAMGVEATEVEALRDMASQSDGAMGGGMGGAMMGRAANAVLGEAPETASEEANMPDSSAESIVAQSPPAAKLHMPPPAQESMQSFALPPPALRSADTNESPDGGSPNGPIEGRGLAKSSVADLDSLAQPEQRQLSANDRSSAVQVQLAHSAGWSADEVTRALPRLAPLLNMPPTPPSGRGDTEQVDIGRAAEIPIALIAQQPVAEKSIPLMDALGQQSVALQQVAPSDAQNYSRHMPADARQAAPTVALFVLREEAEQILKAARQAGEILANPVWITSASGSTTPVGPKQQVVLLFTPQ